MYTPLVLCVLIRVIALTISLMGSVLGCQPRVWDSICFRISVPFSPSPSA